MGAAGGGGGGRLLSGVDRWGGVLSMELGAFSEGGYSTSPAGMASTPLAAAANAPHDAQGTANTSGIPAILHLSEAVIPQSKGARFLSNWATARPATRPCNTSPGTSRRLTLTVSANRKTRLQPTPPAWASAACRKMGDLMAYGPNRRHPTGQHEQTFAADEERLKALFEAGASVVAVGLDRYRVDETLPPGFDLREELRMRKGLAANDQARFG